ncbi:hypothetical protein [Kitasatospora sp. SolWspMP-SS2h]|uniref:hypothetical protein n=1 Tax=Kitasatospora sp. SolWspMP-SS2h TaxID=1305729 RepID=UPI000DBAB9CF|nr:hypothetical protein [Kitasatospora sp. SolWspMP-SS2h]
MSNDEQARTAEFDTTAEPAATGRLTPREPVEPTPVHVGTAAPEPTPLEVQRQGYEPSEAAGRGVLRPEGSSPVRQGTPLEAQYQRQGTPLEAQHASPEAQQQGRASSGALAAPQAGSFVAREEGGEPSAGSGAKQEGDTSDAGAGFQVDPEKYRAAVSPVMAASEQIADLYRSLSAFLPALEAQNPWGDDKSGKKFSEGEKGYLKFSHDTMKTFKSLPDSIKGIADGLKQMAGNYRDADESVVSDLGGIESTVQMPGSPSVPSSPVHVPMTPQITPRGRH